MVVKVSEQVGGIVCYINHVTSISGCILYRDTYNNPCAVMAWGLFHLWGYFFRRWIMLRKQFDNAARLQAGKVYKSEGIGIACDFQQYAHRQKYSSGGGILVHTL